MFIHNLYTTVPESGFMSYIATKPNLVVRIYDTDTCLEIAEKIWNKFDVGESCQIFGFIQAEEMKLRPKGEAVMLLLQEMYEIKHTKGGKRIHEFKDDSIGGPIAHKIFTWNLRVVDSEPRIMIWRYQ